MKTRILVLAGGKSTRLNGEVPKVLRILKGKPMLGHLLLAIRESGIDPRPAIVVGHRAEEIKAAFGSGYDYVFQGEQLGTGDAVKRAEALLRDQAGSVIVLYGDHPFVKPETIRKLAALGAESDNPLSMLTVRVPDFTGWHGYFNDFGRVVRDKSENIVDIIEKKDASPEVLAIKEVSPSYFCFKADWLWQALKKLENNNAAREYYLTDLVRIAISEGKRVSSADVSPVEAIGVNTPEQFELAEKLSF